MITEYPWYEEIDSKEDLLQGDFIDACPIIIPPEQLQEGKVSVEVCEYDVVVMSQSCDLAQKKIDLVLVCPVWLLNEFEKQNDYFKSKKGKEELRRGNNPGYHLLNKCSIKEHGKDYQVVDFRNVFSVPYAFLEAFAKKNRKTRVRLLPPYREHLSQAFARFFMRVGLPADIPPFK
ncbi:hypothetical protein DRO91_10195 [Candidatus Heimdallarchaeota archaeon]|nr:MAG: hypothetical protein DRO63_05055 [Candidatus Gerdarchaeota archaeon]RLI67456.1 MAG: hypothetical protein DRO91_10195 [Candidatus Heimdallarchaeota archaeon]